MTHDQLAKWAKLALLAAVCLLLAGCAVHPGPIAAGVAGSLAVIDQLLVADTISPEQASALRGGIDALQQSVEAVKDGSVSTDEAALAAGGLTAGILGIIKAWRGPATKLAKAVAAPTA